MSRSTRRLFVLAAAAIGCAAQVTGVLTGQTDGQADAPAARAWAVTSGDAHTCAWRSGAVRCWGDNRGGRLGDGTQIARMNPVAVAGGQEATSVTAGLEHTCSWLRNRTVQCWGMNTYGALGDGTRANRATPTTVMGLDGIAGLDAANH